MSGSKWEIIQNLNTGFYHISHVHRDGNSYGLTYNGAYETCCYGCGEEAPRKLMSKARFINKVRRVL